MLPEKEGGTLPGKEVGQAPFAFAAATPSFFHLPGCPLGTKGAAVPVARQPLLSHKNLGIWEQQGCNARG